MFAAESPSSFAFGRLHGRQKSSKLHLASIAKLSTCSKHCYLRRVSEVSYLPSSQHVTLNLTLQNPKIKPKNPPRHPKIGPRSPNLAQDDPKMAPKTYGQSLSKSGSHMFGSPYLAILGPPGPSWAHLGPLSQPSCRPTSPLDAFIAELRPPRPHLLRFDGQSCKLC